MGKGDSCSSNHSFLIVLQFFLRSACPLYGTSLPSACALSPFRALDLALSKVLESLLLENQQKGKIAIVVKQNLLSCVIGERMADFFSGNEIEFSISSDMP